MEMNYKQFSMMSIDGPEVAQFKRNGKNYELVYAVGANGEDSSFLKNATQSEINTFVRTLESLHPSSITEHKRPIGEKLAIINANNEKTTPVRGIINYYDNATAKLTEDLSNSVSKRPVANNDVSFTKYMKKESNGKIEAIIIKKDLDTYSVISAVNSDGEPQKNLTDLSSDRSKKLMDKLIKDHPENTTTSSQLFENTMGLQEKKALSMEYKGDGEITERNKKAEINRVKREKYDLKMANGGVLPVKKEEPKEPVGVDFTTIYASGNEIIVVQKRLNGGTQVVMAQKDGKDIPALLKLDNEKSEKLNSTIINHFNGSLVDGEASKRQLERVVAQNINSDAPQYIQEQIDRQLNKRASLGNAAKFLERKENNGVDSIEYDTNKIDSPRKPSEKTSERSISSKIKV